VRLAERAPGDAPEYLVVHNAGIKGRPILWRQALLFIGVLVGAMCSALWLVLLYLRARSREARAVIARLEAGDLGARFAPDRLDALGHLMLDFNRMADEVEHLVRRLRE